MQIEGMPIRAVLFHLESTLLARTAKWDSGLIKAAIGAPVEMSVLDYIQSLSTAEKKKRILSSLARLERKAAENSKPAPGAGELIRFLGKKNLHLALLSHASLTSVRTLLRTLSGIRAADFSTIISRETLLSQKPAINPIQLAAAQMTLPAQQLLVVSSEPEVLDDATQAGALTVFFNQTASPHASRIEAACQISQLEELKPIVRMAIPLPAGKLPNDLLREFLNQFVFDDPSIIINPGIGEDTAAVNVEPEEILVLKSDPITFATDSIGQYAVLINANDIATSGAKPRWFLTTLLFPHGVTAAGIRDVINELKAFCQRWDITLCGGHTEITDAVTRPVVTGMMAGTVTRRNLIDKRDMAPGDRVLLTKGVAVEGTAIIAREFGLRLKRQGMTESEIRVCREFLNDISILEEARIAARSRATSAMHDVTEGGLATALEELSIAGDHRLQVDMETIPIFPETGKIGQLLDINPLGLIGSGSLLICCRASGCEALLREIRNRGIDVTCIGEVLDRGQGVVARKNKRPCEWPQFEVDEITRLFS